MQIIELAPQNNGAHRNQTISGTVTPPEGWAVVPEGMALPDSFPFVGVEAEDGVVTAMTPGERPDSVPEPEPAYTAEDMLKAMTGG